MRCMDQGSRAFSLKNQTGVLVRNVMYFRLETVCVFDEEHEPGPKKHGMPISLREHPDADVSSIPGTKNIYKGCC